MVPDRSRGGEARRAEDFRWKILMRGLRKIMPRLCKSHIISTITISTIAFLLKLSYNYGNINLFN